MLEQRLIPKEVQVGTNSEEAKDGTFTFTPEQKDVLVNELKLVMAPPLTGKSIEELEKNRQFQSEWLVDYPDFIQNRSEKTDVAIWPGIFLPDSDGKSFNEQISMVVDLNKKISEKGIGVKVIIGKTADNIELFYNLTDGVKGANKNEELLRKGSARSADESPIPSAFAKKGEFGHCITVGNMNPEKRLDVTGYNKPRRPIKGVYVVAMVVPEGLPVPAPVLKPAK